MTGHIINETKTNHTRIMRISRNEFLKALGVSATAALTNFSASAATPQKPALFVVG